MVRDMTEGKPLRLIMQFWLPVMLGNLFQQLYSMTDTIIVGRYVGVNALSAVGATGSINFLVIGFVLGITSGFGIPISQSFGAGDMHQLRKRMVHSLYLCGSFSVLLTVLTVLLTGNLLTAMKTPSDIFDGAYTYIIIIFAGIPATIFYNMFATILRSLGDSKSPLVFLTIGSILNVVLDLVFIIIFSMGVGGAALATVISQAISAILCLIHILRNLPNLRLEKGEGAFSGHIVGTMLSSGIPMALQFSITAIGSILLQSAVNTFGSNVVASVTASSKIQILSTCPMECMGITMATYCGQNLGARKYDRIKSGILKAFCIQMIFAAIAFSIVFFFGIPMSGLFLVGDSAQISEITVTLKQLLLVNGLFFPALGTLLLLRNALQGLGFGLLAMTAGIFEMVARTLVAFLLVIPMGFDAICAANPAAWIAACLLLVPAYVFASKKLRKSLA